MVDSEQMVDSEYMQATGPLIDAINIAVADVIFGAIRKGAVCRAASVTIRSR